MEPEIEIVMADLSRAVLVAPLFDEYRQFYGRPSDIAAAQQFLEQRLSRGESIVLCAMVAGVAEPVGFAQLYPTFSSLQLAPVLVLNDLYVRRASRRLGIARTLLLATHDIARERGMTEVSLETARDNAAAKFLYESEGYRTDVDFEHYHLSLH